jgi:hypothetical protein
LFFQSYQLKDFLKNFKYDYHIKKGETQAFIYTKLNAFKFAKVARRRRFMRFVPEALLTIVTFVFKLMLFNLLLVLISYNIGDAKLFFPWKN